MGKLRVREVTQLEAGAAVARAGCTIAHCAEDFGKMEHGAPLPSPTARGPCFTFTWNAFFFFFNKITLTSNVGRVKDKSLL